VGLPDGPNFDVTSVAVGDDGTQYLGGFFTRWGPQTGGGAAVDATSGDLNESFPHVEGRVQASASDGLGGVYIGGDFTSVDGQPRNGLAHIDDGALASWGPDIGEYSAVQALAVSARRST
jgi:hypothetical protein